jgi:hypothetical protein
MPADENSTFSADGNNRQAVDRIKKRLENKYGYCIRLNYKEC